MGASHKRLLEAKRGLVRLRNKDPEAFEEVMQSCSERGWSKVLKGIEPHADRRKITLAVEAMLVAQWLRAEERGMTRKQFYDLAFKEKWLFAGYKWTGKEGIKRQLEHSYPKWDKKDPDFQALVEEAEQEICTLEAQEAALRKGARQD